MNEEIKRLHVISSMGKWKTKRVESPDFSFRGKVKTFPTKELAITYAKTLKGYELIIHKMDGSVEEWLK